MACKTSEKIRDNRRDAVEGETNSITKDLAERKPRTAGFVGDIRGINHMRPASPVGAAPDRRLTPCRNFSR